MKWGTRTAAVLAVSSACAAVAVAQQPADSARRRQEIDSIIARIVGEKLDSALQAATPRPASQAPANRGSYMNMGFDVLTDVGSSTEPDVRALQPGDHDPAVRGFTLPNAELTIDATVDPYFKGFAAIAFKIDENGESGVELEEANFITTSLPWNLQIKGGQILGEFGRQNATHPHAWAFVDQPLAMNRVFGPDGLRGVGARISWLLPTSFYTEAMLSVLNSTGETASSFRSAESPQIHGGIPEASFVGGLQDLILVPRLATSFDVGDTHTFLLGVSGAFGPNNSGLDTRTDILGADLYWKWKPVTAQQGFPFLSWQTEAFSRRYEAASRLALADPFVTLPSETLRDRSGYSQVLWGIKPRLVAGVRGDIALGDPGAFDSELRIDRSRWSPNLTWYPSEFSKLRLQYNYDRREGMGADHSLWLQLEIILGAHAAHKF